MRDEHTLSPQRHTKAHYVSVVHPGTFRHQIESGLHRQATLFCDCEISSHADQPKKKLFHVRAPVALLKLLAIDARHRPSP